MPIDLIVKKVKKLDSIPKKFLTDVQKSQYQVLDKLLTEFGKLELDVAGNIKMNSANMILLEDINNELAMIFNESEYIDSVIDFASSFDINKSITDKYFSNIFKDFKQGDFSNAVYETSKRNAIESLSSSTVKTKFLEPLKAEMTQMVSSGMSFQDSVQRLRDYAIGDGENAGKLLQYSKQIAYDTLAVSDRAYTSAVAEELDAEWFYYAGGLIATSRPFCEERNNKYFYYLEVQEWASLDWGGKIANTTPQNIYENLGGYNCNHVLIPVSIDQVPKSVIDRNIKNGNYQPPPDFDRIDTKVKGKYEYSE